MQGSSAGQKVSIWMATQERPAFAALTTNLDVDVCVVGAGIAGLTTAYLLGREGRRVAVLDDGPIYAGQTERTTAHLASALDDRFHRLEKLFGESGSRLAAESHAKAIDTIETIIGRENIACDFERLDGYLFLGRGDSEDWLRKELEAARRAGLVGVEWVARAPLTFETGPALRFPNQGQFHPTTYLTGLARAIQRDGGQIFTHSAAAEFEGGTRTRVKTRAGQTVTAGALVVATNTPVNDRVTMHTKQAPYRTYAIGAQVPTGSVPKALYWDTLDPYHYVRLHTGTDGASGAEHQILIVGGEDHKTGQASDLQERFSRLEAWTRERFPIQGVEYQWSGQVMEPVDGLAFIGKNPGDDENVFIATGDSGQGITHGTIAGLLLTDLICGRPNPWAKLYDPGRKNLGSIAEFVRENINVVAQYADYIRGGDVTDAAQLAPDTGAVIRSGSKKLAVYRDAAGQLHQFSAVCPHLGCLVAWNPVEKTWDCPCHGSIFDCLGTMVNGPSLTDLPRQDTAGS